MKHIDKVFKDKLYHQTAEVPEGMWEKIAPALEEESGRGLLWFWFAGLSALILAGMAYYFLNSNSSQINTPLVDNMEMQEELVQSEAGALTKLALSSPIGNSILKKNSPDDINAEIPTERNNVPKTKTNIVPESMSKPSNAQALVTTSTLDLKKAATEHITDFNPEGKPANLVITKSYISDEGAIVEKSNLYKDNSTEPTYNVFINSEGLGAGTLMRIIEPLENIPLPAFKSQLKKKIELKNF